MTNRPAILVVLLICLPLAACGGKADSPGSTESSTVSGYKTPEALLEAIATMGDDGEVPSPVDLVRLVHPNEQKATAFVISVLPLLFVPLAAAFGGEEKKKEMEPLLLEMGEIMKKYGLEDVNEKMETMGSPEGLSEEDKLKTFNEALKDVDHIALMEESWAFMKRFSEKSKSDSKDGEVTETSSFEAFTPENLAKAKESLKVEGKRATMVDPSDAEKTIVLVQADDGFWYISALESKLLGE